MEEQQRLELEEEQRQEQDRQRERRATQLTISCGVAAKSLSTCCTLCRGIRSCRLAVVHASALLVSRGHVFTAIVWGAPSSLSLPVLIPSAA